MSIQHKKIVILAPRRFGKTWFVKNTLGISEENIKASCSTRDDVADAVFSDVYTHIECTPSQKEIFEGLEDHIEEVWIRPHGLDWVCLRSDWNEVGGIMNHVNKLTEISFDRESKL